MLETKPVRAVLASVGGSPSPVLYVLRQKRPSVVWYFCSAGSRDTVESIHPQLDWHPDRDFVEADRFEELGPCYRALRRAIPDLLRKWKVQAEEVLVDYTGGTKTMSAALALAGTEFFQQFSYIGAMQREKGGLGVAMDGREKAHYQDNPWTELAVREIERAGDLWNGGLYETAATTLRLVAERMSSQTDPMMRRPLKFEAVAQLSEAMAARRRLDFTAAFKLLSPLKRNLPALFDGRDDLGLLSFLDSSREICEACKADAVGATFLRELLDNALWTADQSRYEDAAARLYRAMEMQGQIWLEDQTDGLFVNGKCKGQAVKRIPEKISSLEFCKVRERNGAQEVVLSMEQTFVALAALGHRQADGILSDLQSVDARGKSTSRWRRASEQRNASILGHGVQSIGAEGFQRMKDIASDFLGFDLSKEKNPIPKWDSRWLSDEL